MNYAAGLVVIIYMPYYHDMDMNVKKYIDISIYI